MFKSSSFILLTVYKCICEGSIAQYNVSIGPKSNQRDTKVTLIQRLSPWQPPVKGGVDAPRKKTEKPFKLADCDPAAKPFSTGDKKSDKAAVETLALELDELQNLFYADKRFKLLVILQGTDTSGKDGTLRGVFSRVTPLGVRTVGWKAPTEDERAHDYLWRIHQHTPGVGEFMLFNRSQYEDVLVPPVNGWITPEQTAQRYAQINDFERMLSENGTIILKFMLHISYKEQGARLQERLDDETAWATWRCANSGRRISKRTKTCSTPPARRGHLGPWCPPTPNLTAT